MPCRMFGYAGRSESDVRELFAGLKRACANDPTLSGIVAGCSRHSHGWGYVIHAANGLFHYRSAQSIYEDDAALPKMEGEIRAIFHGRFATNQELMAHIFCHPFVAATDRALLYFAHNGSVTPTVQTDRKVDSEWALDEVAAAGLEAALPKLKEQTVSALNILVLTVPRGSGAAPILHGLNFFKPTEKPKVDYYRMYCGKMPGGGAFVSSTLTLEGAKVDNLKVTGPAPFGELLALSP